MIEAGDTHRGQGQGKPLFRQIPGGRKTHRQRRIDSCGRTEGEIGELALL